MAVRSFAPHRAGISALYLLHDHRSKNNSAEQVGAVSVAFCIAFVEMILRLNQVVYAPFYALFLVGPIATVAELWMQSRRKLQSATA